MDAVIYLVVLAVVLLGGLYLAERHNARVDRRQAKREQRSA